jgi:adenosylcobinamide kinase/adenosylcobinamide-phosphate guanylyltransferase
MHTVNRTFIFGGARSGKSAYAEQLAERLAKESGKEVVYLATAQAGDAEMQSRIAHHRRQRPSHWRTVEETLALGPAIERWSTPQRVILIDCLTLWLSNLLFAGDVQHPEIGEIVLPALFHEQRAHFLQALEAAAGDLIIVSNEVGMGIVPYGAISRCFTDEAGRLNQAVAAACERAVWVAAGLPLILKGA